MKPAQERLVPGQLGEARRGDGAEQPHGVGVRGPPALRVGRLEELSGLGVPGPAQVAGEVAERSQGFGEDGTHGESTNGLHVSHLYRGRTDPRGRTTVGALSVTLDGSGARCRATTARDRLSGSAPAPSGRPCPGRCTVRALPPPAPGPPLSPGSRGHRGPLTPHGPDAPVTYPSVTGDMADFPSSRGLVAPRTSGKAAGVPTRRPGDRRAAHSACSGCTQELTHHRVGRPKTVGRLPR